MEASTPIAGTVASQAAATCESCREIRFLQVFEAAAIGIAICDFDGRILDGNAALARLLGHEHEKLTGLDPWRFYDSDSSNSRLLAELLQGQRDSFTVEKQYQRKGTSDFWGQLTVSIARDAHDDPAFLVVLLEDVTARKSLEEQLRQAEKNGVGRPPYRKHRPRL